MSAREELTADEIRYDLIDSDGVLTHVDASAEATRYHVWSVNTGTDRVIALVNFGTSIMLPLSTGPWHWTYLADKIGKDNSRTGMALALIIARIEQAEQEATS
jgi:hypothetical protein